MTNYFVILGLPAALVRIIAKRNHRGCVCALLEFGILMSQLIFLPESIVVVEIIAVNMSIASIILYKMMFAVYKIMYPV